MFISILDVLFAMKKGFLTLSPIFLRGNWRVVSLTEVRDVG